MYSVEYLIEVTDRHARQRLGGNDELVAIAWVLAWYFWHTGPKDVPASCYARAAVRAALGGRDLPGVQPSKKHDAMDRNVILAGDMTGVRDLSPGPDRRAMDRE